LGRNFDLTIFYILPLINNLQKIKINNHTNLLFSLQYFHKHRFCPEQFNFVYLKPFLLSSCLFSRNQLQILIIAIQSSNNGIKEDEDYFSSSSWKGCCIYNCILLTKLADNTETSSVTISEKQLRRNNSDILQHDISWNKSVALHQSCV